LELLLALKSRTGHRTVQAATLLLVLVCITIPLYLDSLHRADGLPQSWSSAAIWVESADCARETGAILVLCQGGKLVPIADHSAGDDPGQALWLGAYAALTQHAVTQEDVSRMNSTLNYAGLILLARLLFSLRLPIVTFLVLTGGAVIANQFHSLGPHPGHFGVACLATILPLAIVGLPLVSESRRLFWIWVVVGIASSGVALLFREAIGFMGVVVGLIAVGASYLAASGAQRGQLVYLVLIGGVLSSLFVPQLVLGARNHAYGIEPSGRMEQHGAWHNLYIGLGVVENPFGIEWLDDNAVQTVKKIDPTIQYLSKKYYDTLRREYFRIVLSDPLQVAIIYFQKFWMALKAYGTWAMVLGIAALTAWGRRRLHSAAGGWAAYDAILLVSGAFIALFLAQATLINFSKLYLFPVKLFLLLGLGAVLELLFVIPGSTWRLEPHR
jgi:hypothetical protein